MQDRSSMPHSGAEGSGNTGPYITGFGSGMNSGTGPYMIGFGSALKKGTGSAARAPPTAGAIQQSEPIRRPNPALSITHPTRQLGSILYHGAHRRPCYRPRSL